MAGLDWSALGPLVGVCISAGVMLYGFSRTVPIQRRTVAINERESLEKIIAALRDNIREIGDDLDAVRRELQAERLANVGCTERTNRLQFDLDGAKAKVATTEEAMRVMAIELATLRQRVKAVEDVYPELPKALGWA